MTSDEFHRLAEERGYDFDGAERDAPLTLNRLAELERQKGIKFPAFYKGFLGMYGAGDFGCVTVLSPEPGSRFGIWEKASQLEDRECNFIAVVDLDSYHFGFLVEQGVCSNDIWNVDHDFEPEVWDADYPDFGFLAKVALNVWDDEDEIEEEE